MPKTLTETFGFSAGKVDRTGVAPVVKNVLLCGPVSANRRRYLASAFEGSRVNRYNGAPVFLNHSGRHEDRVYQDKIAVVENVRHRADGMPVGDLRVNPGHPFREAFLFDAEHSPTSCGMSHVAACQTRTAKDGTEEIIAVDAVESVDVVLKPATSAGLYESRMATLIRESVGVRSDSRGSFLESITAKPPTFQGQRPSRPATPPRRRESAQSRAAASLAEFLDNIRG